MHQILKNYEGFIFDLDGTVYRESKLIDSSNRLFKTLKDLKKKYVFVSNRTTSTNFAYKRKLNSFGIECSLSQIITAAEVTKNYISINHPDAKVLVIGEKIFINYLKRNGIKIANHNVDIVLVTLDRTLNFKKIYRAQRALEKGANFFAANIDYTCPIEHGEILDAGYTIQILENLTNRKLEKNFGKPSALIAEEILNRLKLERSKCILIGDRLETDILLANNNNIDSALVLSGVTRKEQIDLSPIKPTYVLNSIADLTADF